MKLIQIILLGTCLGCASEIIVHSDSDKDILGWPYTTYNWLNDKEIESRNNPLYYNELTDKRIKTATADEFKKKGYTLNSNSPDILVHYHIVTQQRSKVLTEPMGYHYGPYWLRSRVDVIEYDEGTIILDLMDSKNKNLIWRGWAISVLAEKDIVPKEMVDKSIKKIFSQLPSAKNIPEEKSLK
jgi:hypothetical protein